MLGFEITSNNLTNPFLDLKGQSMNKITLVYWQGEEYFLGKILEHPEIMTQGETLAELIENIKDAYYLMIFDDVPEGYEVKEIAV